MNDVERGDISRREIIDEEAFAWVVKMRGVETGAYPDSKIEELRSQFDAWRKTSAEHQRAFDWASGHLDTSETLKQSQRHGVDRPLRPKRAPFARLALLVTTAAVAALYVSFAARESSVPGEHLALGIAPIASAHGQIRVFSLADGTRVTLDSDSRANVAMTAAERRVQLERGKARITVAKERRPFIVNAGAGNIRAQAAAIDLTYRDEPDVEVRLISGTATAVPAAQPAVYTGDGIALRTDRLLHYPAVAFKPTQSRQPARGDDDWTSGWVEYREIALGRLIADANRYAAQPIVIDDPQTATRLVSGRFCIIETATFVRRIAMALDLHVTKRADGIHLHRP